MDGNLLKRSNPLGQWPRIAEGCREADALNGGRKEDEAFLPDLAPVRVVDVVAFVEDDYAEVLE